ncbi:unnamed protein product [Arabidopsis halleri]
MRERSSPINIGNGSSFLGEGGDPEGEEALLETVLSFFCRCREESPRDLICRPDL